MPNLLVTFLILAILIGLNALYVLAEFSAVSSRRARLTQMSEDGNAVARHILEIIEHPHKLDAYVATSQVGITISSLVLGFYGQARLSEYLVPIFSRLGDFSEAAALSVSATTVLLVLTLFQVLFGELVPKNLGIQEPERFSILTHTPMQWSEWVMKPLIWLLNGSGILLMRLLRIEPSSEHGHIHSPEELSMLIYESGQGGAISVGEYLLLSNTMRMREAQVKHIMIPRAQMTVASNDIAIGELTGLVSSSPFSRIPIYDGSVDNIIGIVHLRDLFCINILDQEHITPLADLIRPVQFFPETMQVKTVFSRLQKAQNQVAIILDEFGGTSGMVTLEDLVEEIFGDLQDEFDQELPDIQILSETRLLIRGSMPLSEVNELLGIDLPAQDVDTIGGLLTAQIGDIPAVNQKIAVGEFAFTIHKMRGRAVSSTILTTTPDVIKTFRQTQ